MKTQAEQFGELWEAVRDTQFGSTAAEANDLFHITKVEFQPPSRAHVKRLKRQRCLVLNRPAQTDKGPDQARVQYNAHAKTAFQILRYYNSHAGKRVAELEPNPEVRRPFVAKKPDVISTKQDQPASNSADLRRKHFVALAKMTKPWQGWTAKYSMEVLDLFGSFENFERAYA